MVTRFPAADIVYLALCVTSAVFCNNFVWWNFAKFALLVPTEGVFGTAR